jgi:general secretion pathway protein G
MNVPVSNQPVKTEGFSLVEVLIAITVIAALTAIALPKFNSYKDQQKVSLAVADLRVLDNQIKSYKLNNEKLPAALSDLPQLAPSDPWGRAYQYLNIEDADAKTKGSIRKDKNLVPINSDFDLYSKGPDGKSTPPLTAKDSLDDIVRANDGGYFGVASKY